MPRLTKKLSVPDGRTAPNYKKASLLKILTLQDCVKVVFPGHPHSVEFYGTYSPKKTDS